MSKQQDSSFVDPDEVEESVSNWANGSASGCLLGLIILLVFVGFIGFAITYPVMFGVP